MIAGVALSIVAASVRSRLPHPDANARMRSLPLRPTPVQGPRRQHNPVPWIAFPAGRSKGSRHLAGKGLLLIEESPRPTGRSPPLHSSALFPPSHLTKITRGNRACLIRSSPLFESLRQWIVSVASSSTRPLKLLLEGSCKYATSSARPCCSGNNSQSSRSVTCGRPCSNRQIDISRRCRNAHKLIRWWRGTQGQGFGFDIVQKIHDSTVFQPRLVVQKSPKLLAQVSDGSLSMLTGFQPVIVHAADARIGFEL